MNKSRYCIALLLVILTAGCGSGGDSGNSFSFEKQGRTVPAFNADSAYRFIEQQVSMGPRNPNSKGHRQARQYLLAKFRTYASAQTVYSQNFSAQGYKNDLELTNIIAAFNPQAKDRIMLCAHWDTRPRADQDSVRSQQPIIGADDGGSGVAVLLELARLFKKHKPPVGVDIVLFDGEDYGKEGDLSKYFLGSRHWAKNPPVAGYDPRFAILLDMVGARGAQFPREQYSMRYAPGLVNEVWDIAGSMNYGNLFLDKNGNAVSDDHVIINREQGIPTINIINRRLSSGSSNFAPYWHTHDDNMDIIQKSTLQKVGDVLTELVYNRIETEG